MEHSHKTIAATVITTIATNGEGIAFVKRGRINKPIFAPSSFSREIYRQRNIVERAINRLKQFRRIATRDEKLATNYTAMITIACILLWL